MSFPGWPTGVVMPSGAMYDRALAEATRCGKLNAHMPSPTVQITLCPNAPVIEFQSRAKTQKLCRAPACWQDFGVLGSQIIIDAKYRNDPVTMRKIVVHETAHSLGWRH
jgi:hypothetical protein